MLFDSSHVSNICKTVFPSEKYLISNKLWHMLSVSNAEMVIHSFLTSDSFCTFFLRVWVQYMWTCICVIDFFQECVCVLSLADKNWRKWIVGVDKERTSQGRRGEDKCNCLCLSATVCYRTTNPRRSGDAHLVDSPLSCRCTQLRQTYQKRQKRRN